MRMRRSSPESGFTLLEVLVAFAVLAVMIVPILQVFGGGLGTTETARAYTTATLLARSKLAEVGVAETLAEGEMTGTFDVPGYRWRCSIALDTSEVVPMEPYGAVEEAGVRRGGVGERRGGLGQGGTSGRRTAASSRRSVRSQDAASSLASDAARRLDRGGSPADVLIPYEVTVTVEWDNLRSGGAVTLSSLRLGRQANNLGPASNE